MCVKAWKDGADNGGATWQGVTKDKITVIAVLPNDAQLETDPVKPKNKADKSPSTYQNAIHDMLIPQLKYFETWGRDLEVKFVTSSGSDEAAQRADAVAIKSMKPFAVFDLIVAGLDVLETELAKAKIPNFGFSATAKKSNLQAPYRWGPSDAQSSAINSAEVIGKQLVGKKAEFAGDDVSGQTRKFGVVYIPTLVDIDDFKSYFKKYGGTIASENSYPANGSTFGTASVSEEQAPTMVTRMKAAGVTTVIMLSDFSMNKALMDNATRQEWHPEWFFTGAIYADIGILARAYPAEQSTHAFGLSFLTPFTELDPPPPPPQLPLSTLTDPSNWYWGVDAGTQAGAVSPDLIWLLNGIHAAGPNLTPKTLQQGLFAIPRFGGRRAEPYEQHPLRVRQGAQPAVRRVRAERRRLRSVLVGPHHHGAVERSGRDGQGSGLVRQRRQALHRGHVAEEAVRLVRQGHVGVPLRDPTDAGAHLRRSVRRVSVHRRPRPDRLDEQQRLHRQSQRRRRNLALTRFAADRVERRIVRRWRTPVLPASRVRRHPTRRRPRSSGAIVASPTASSTRGSIGWRGS